MEYPHVQIGDTSSTGLFSIAMLVRRSVSLLSPAGRCQTAYLCREQNGRRKVELKTAEKGSVEAVVWRGRKGKV